VVTHSGNNQVTLEVRRGPTGGSSTHLGDIVVALPSSGDSVCIFTLSGECQEHRSQERATLCISGRRPTLRLETG